METKRKYKVWQLIPVSPATGEAEAEELQIQGQSEQLSKTLSQKCNKDLEGR